VSFSFVTNHACDRQPDGQTDRITTPKAALAYARAVKNATYAPFGSLDCKYVKFKFGFKCTIVNIGSNGSRIKNSPNSMGCYGLQQTHEMHTVMLQYSF